MTHGTERGTTAGGTTDGRDEPAARPADDARGGAETPAVPAPRLPAPAAHDAVTPTDATAAAGAADRTDGDTGAERTAGTGAAPADEAARADAPTGAAPAPARPVTERTRPLSAGPALAAWPSWEDVAVTAPPADAARPAGAAEAATTEDDAADAATADDDAAVPAQDGTPDADEPTAAAATAARPADEPQRLSFGGLSALAMTALNAAAVGVPAHALARSEIDPAAGARTGAADDGAAGSSGTEASAAPDDGQSGVGTSTDATGEAATGAAATRAADASATDATAESATSDATATDATATDATATDATATEEGARAATPTDADGAAADAAATAPDVDDAGPATDAHDTDAPAGADAVHDADASTAAAQVTDAPAAAAPGADASTAAAQVTDAPAAAAQESAAPTAAAQDTDAPAADAQDIRAQHTDAQHTDAQHTDAPAPGAPAPTVPTTDAPSSASASPTADRPVPDATPAPPADGSTGAAVTDEPTDTAAVPVVLAPAAGAAAAATAGAATDSAAGNPAAPETGTPRSTDAPTPPAARSADASATQVVPPTPPADPAATPVVPPTRPADPEATQVVPPVTGTPTAAGAIAAGTTSAGATAAAAATTRTWPTTDAGGAEARRAPGGPVPQTDVEREPSPLDDFEPEDGRRRWPRTLAVVGGVVVLLGGAYVGASYALAERVPRGATVAGVEIGGMTADEARDALTTGLADRTSQPVPVVAQDAQAEVDPVAAGLVFDADATVARLTGVDLAEPVRLWRQLVGVDAQPPVTQVDDDALGTALGSLSESVRLAPVDGSVVFADGAAHATDAADGWELDVEAATATVHEDWLVGERPLALPTTPVAPDITQEETQQALTQVAQPLASAPITVQVADRQAVLDVPTLTGSASMVPVGGALELQLDGEALTQAVLAQVPDVVTAASDARFEFQGDAPVIVPGTPGTSLDPAALAASVAASVTAEQRVAPVDLVASDPAQTTAALEALGVKEVVSEFSTPLTSEPRRTQNIAAGLANITGTLVRPDETFSLTDALGPVDAAHGFVQAGAIVNGEHKDAWGGGLSQVSTTVFNAAYFAGFEDVEHTPHSEWFQRYPEGREATIFTGVLDMRWKNNTPYGALVQGWVADGRAHVRIWGTKHFTVETEKSGRSGVVAPTTVYSQSPTCEPQSAGNPGFSVTNTRRVFLNGQLVDTESDSWRYKPQNKIVCGSAPSPTP